MKYPYIIIDDEHESVLETQSAFDSFSNYFLLGTADNYDDAVNLVLEHNPKLIVLEIDPVNKESRLSLALINELHRYVKNMPKIIILTKGKELAYEALKNEVFDYLLKPINIHELRKTIMKFERNVEQTPTTICIKSYGDYRFVDTDDIVYLQADNNSTDLYINNGDTITAFKTLKHFENTLPPQFVRIHNSYIINMSYVSRIHLGNNVVYIKNSKIQLPFSKSYKKNVDLIISLIANSEGKEL
ncbi:DNA-binding LytR/AlgR family response regulator [Flavobacterium arsenatis]|uniref:DNA-binding LytR/AlgR family response regulator n=1 Tax=Flavobacterium arsenatis TaxID=1484332 RepID=A0ABU1TSV1_9FLAO|nr:LytTR family DNA-binding domain-containing protein [Flavobacterium arsenatis]MDR6968968.1 DNA-binding LytR/AlgR family response regulator [Flavobacterium arsenatis]